MRFFLALIIILAPIALAATNVANTASWENVYSAGMYTALQDKQFKFVASQRQAERLAAILQEHENITIIESDTLPYAKRYANRLKRDNIIADTIIIPEDSGNLDLAKRTSTKKFIIVDPTYGYDALSVIPYARHLNAYVLFAEKENIADILSFLTLREPDYLLLYGNLDAEVLNALQSYSPEIINEKSRYKNNIAINERLRAATGTRQAILTNGEFIEQDLYLAGQPVYFIGRDNTPDVILSYLTTTPFDSFIVIGNDLLPSAERIKDTTQKPTFIKFAKGTTGSGGTYKDVEALDTYPVPQITLNLETLGLYYNTASGNIELALRNTQDVRTFLSTSLVIKGDGEALATLGDDLASINELETRAFTYPHTLNPASYTTLTADVFIAYGADEESFERAITATLPIQLVNQDDDCTLSIEDTTYNKQTQRFEVTLTSPMPCYARAQIINLTVDDDQTTIQSDVQAINGALRVPIKQRLDDVDIADNPFITVRAEFGTRKEVLTHSINKTFPLAIKTTTNWMLIGALAIIIILTILLIWKRKR